MTWSIPKMWEGQACVIMASGESMSKEVAEKIKASAATHRVIVINNTIELAPWADMLYAADPEWWNVKENKQRWTAFEGLKVTCTANTYPQVLKLKTGGMDGFNEDPSILNTGGNSGYQALCIAAHAGCSRVLLTGFDMKGGHWHKAHIAPLRETNQSLYPRWVERFQTLVKPLAARGVEVINCTPGSALNTWAHQDLDEALLNRETTA